MRSSFSPFLAFTLGAIFHVLTCCTAHAQYDKDSLWAIWQDPTRSDTDRLRALSTFTWHGYLMSDPDSAFHYGQIMYDYAARKGMKREMAYALRGQGVTFKLRDDNIKALEYFERSMELSEEVDDLAGVAGSLNNIGMMFLEQGDLQKALDYHGRSLELRRTANDVRGIGGSLSNIGHVHLAAGDLDRAMEMYHQAMVVWKEDGFLQGEANALSYMGKVILRRKDHKSAMEHFRQSLSLYQAFDDRLDVARTLIDIGLLNLETNDVHQALDDCLDGLGIARSYQSIYEQERACDCAYKAHKAMGNKDLALEFLELANALSDSMRNEEVSKRLQRSEFTRAFRTDSIARAEREQRLAVQNEAVVARMKNRNDLFLFSGVGVLALAIGLWSRLRYTRRAKELADSLRRRAELSERAKHQFLANMSHEIRTPMNAIMGMTGILLRNQHAPDQVRYLKAIERSSEDLLVILNDILDLSKIESGRMDIEVLPFDPRTIVNDVQTVFQYKAEEKGLILIVEQGNEIPSVLVGDPTRLRQILVNLVGNAIKFTEKGKVTIRISVESRTPVACSLRIDVVDTGIGVPKDKQEKIFEEFDQAYSDTSRRFGGTGLGLTISKRLVEVQGGTISVSSEKGEGSTFTVTIPYGLGSAPDPVAQVPLEFTLGDLHILLVEDNEFNVIVARDELLDAIPGARVDVAVNGSEALDRIGKVDYDMVLMDVQMPEMNGYEATRAIRAMAGPMSRIPIVAMTANVMRDELDRCREAGMDGYVPKPFKREELLHAMHEALKAGKR